VEINRGLLKVDPVEFLRDLADSRVKLSDLDTLREETHELARVREAAIEQLDGLAEGISEAIRAGGLLTIGLALVVHHDLRDLGSLVHLRAPLTRCALAL